MTFFSIYDIILLENKKGRKKYMDWIDFVSLMHYMVDTYGVPYGYGDEETEGKIPNLEEDCESAWFECCHCSEPIYYSDWKDELIDNSFEWSEENVKCPICEEEW